eukprot:g461.t1
MTADIKATRSDKNGRGSASMTSAPTKSASSDTLKLWIFLPLLSAALAVCFLRSKSTGELKNKAAEESAPFDGDCRPNPANSRFVEKRNATTLSEAEFLACYAGKAPVILTLEGWSNPAEWSAEAMEERSEEVSVLRTRSWRGGYSGDRQMSLGSFVKSGLCEEDEGYIFSSNFFGSNTCTFGKAIPSWLSARVGSPCQSFLAIGGSNTGVGFHTHTDAWNGVIRGSKRWLMFPPGESPPGGPGAMSTIVWMERLGRLKDIRKPIEFTQQAGEIVYTPEAWAHAVQNMGGCVVAVSFQSLTPRTQVEKDRIRLQSIRDAIHSSVEGPSRHDLERIGEETLKTFQAMIDTYPELAEAHFLLSGAYGDIGDQDRAQRAVDDALALDPYYLDAMTTTNDDWKKKWADVTPVPQDDGPAPICPIAYTKEFVETMDYFRAAFLSNELSERSLELSKRAIELNFANYTAWYFRRLCLFKLRDKTALRKEFEFIDDCLSASPKNYQIWFHRRLIVERIGDGSRELAVTASVLEEDAKNYHAWSHRQWAIQTYNLWAKELAFVVSLIKKDPRNNSAWNQRMFVVTRCGTVAPSKTDLDREIAFALEHIRTIPGNESPYAYLRGLLKKKKMSDYPAIAAAVAEIKASSLGRECAAVLSLELDLLIEGGRFAEARKMCDLLGSKVDTIRKKYWDHLKRKKCGETSPAGAAKEDSARAPSGV